MPWLSPTLNLKWGSYFREDPAEQQQLVAMTVAAKNAGLITKRIALERLSGVFDVDNIDAVLEALDEEAQQAAADEHEKQMQLQHALASGLKNGTGPGQPGSKPGPGGAKNPPPGRGGAGPDVAMAAKGKGQPPK